MWTLRQGRQEVRLGLKLPFPRWGQSRNPLSQPLRELWTVASPKIGKYLTVFGSCLSSPSYELSGLRKVLGQQLEWQFFMYKMWWWREPVVWAMLTAEPGVAHPVLRELGTAPLTLIQNLMVALILPLCIQLQLPLYFPTMAIFLPVFSLSNYLYHFIWNKLLINSI